jgi:hypothetical protein
MLILILRACLVERQPDAAPPKLESVLPAEPRKIQSHPSVETAHPDEKRTIKSEDKTQENSE